MKKLVGLGILIGSIVVSQLSIVASELPNVRAKGAVLIEQESGRVLFEKNAYEPLPMASTTKIMTCIVALEEGNVDDIVTVSARASSAPPVKLHLKKGEKQRLGDLLYALMLQSDNDAAVAIAEHVGGSVEQFCEMMTQKAQALGAEHTSFRTPNGLDAEGHYASSYDLAIIGSYALKNPEFVKIVTTTNITIPTVPVEGSRTYDVQCKNRFLYSYEGANGLKTGFTNKAGHCFVGGAKRNDMQLIGVALASGWGQVGKTQKYTDVINMMNYGFKNYNMVELITPKKDYCMVPVDEAIVTEIALACDNQIRLPLTQDEQANITVEQSVPERISAPIDEGQVIGKLQVICKGEVLAEAPLIAQESVKKASILDYLKSWLEKNK